eukprot:5100081-Heterocapsa_arctica.AAC.1
MGHEVQTCGDYEYYLGCGRNSKAKHSILAKRVLWRRENTVSQSLDCRDTGGEITTYVLTIGGHVRTV